MAFSAGQIPTAAQLDGIFAVQTAMKTADESVTSSTVLQNDDHLSLSIAASSVYLFEFEFAYTAAAAGDLKTTFTGPAGMGGTLFAWSSASASTASASLSPTSTLIWDGLGAEAVAWLKGRLTTAGTAGTLRLQFAQNASSGTASTIRTGTFLRITKIS